MEVDFFAESDQVLLPDLIVHVSSDVVLHLHHFDLGFQLINSSIVVKIVFYGVSKRVGILQVRIVIIKTVFQSERVDSRIFILELPLLIDHLRLRAVVSLMVLRFFNLIVCLTVSVVVIVMQSYVLAWLFNYIHFCSFCFDLVNWIILWRCFRSLSIVVRAHIWTCVVLFLVLFSIKVCILVDILLNYLSLEEFVLGPVTLSQLVFISGS